MASSTENPKTPSGRKYPRHKAPKGLAVGWRGAGRGEVSPAETISVGGLFLHTPNPLPKGSTLDLLFDLKSGEVRARAVVKHHEPGKGMGVQFIQMQPAARARLNQLLARYMSVQAQSPSAPNNRRTAEAQPFVPREATPVAATDNAASFERELAAALDAARGGTSYRLLGVSPEADEKQIKEAFHSLARKFHPDHHMGEQKLMGRLQELMGIASAAYKTLTDAERRAQYDQRLAASGAFNLRRGKTAAQETVEQCFAHANECLRAENFAGSIVWLRKCVELSPDDARYRALLARSLGAIEQYRDEAIAEFGRAIQMDPWNTAPYMQFAELCESMQLPSRARILYAKVLEINPVHAKARERLAQLEQTVKS